MRRKSFTLLEVLIAGGILFIVSAAVVGLNNSIIAGTAVNADVTVLNRWSSEGLELATASRDNNLINGNPQNGNQLWLNQAADTNLYGWYVLAQAGNNWSLTPATGVSNTLAYSAIATTNAEVKTSQAVTAYRLICIEAVGALDGHDSTSVSCNTVNGVNSSAISSDGQRSNTAFPCDGNDAYCNNSVASLNRDLLAGATQTIVPPGNAVKIRAVVVTQNKSNYTVTDVATLLTNWKGFEQL